jgi:hypothetical protein
MRKTITVLTLLIAVVTASAWYARLMPADTTGNFSRLSGDPTANTDRSVIREHPESLPDNSADSRVGQRAVGLAVTGPALSSDTETEDEDEIEQSRDGETEDGEETKEDQCGTKLSRVTVSALSSDEDRVGEQEGEEDGDEDDKDDEDKEAEGGGPDRLWGAVKLGQSFPDPTAWTSS